MRSSIGSSGLIWSGLTVPWLQEPPARNGQRPHVPASADTKQAKHLPTRGGARVNAKLPWWVQGLASACGVAGLELYVRQHHRERDLARLRATISASGQQESAH
jgi:hypothetical protein